MSVSRRFQTPARLIANALPCSLAVPLLLVGLVLLLNPEIDPGFAGLLSAWGMLTVAYGLPLLVGLPLGFSAIRFFAAHPLRIGWFQPKAAVWFLVVGIGGCIAIHAANLILIGDRLTAGGKAHLTVALAFEVVAWTVASTLTVLAQWRRGAEVDVRHQIALALLLGAPLVSALYAWSVSGDRSPAPPYVTPEAATRRGLVMILGIEGATFNEVLPLASEGRLPNFARLMKEGAYGPLRTVNPCRSPVAWASLATGMLPSRHGLKDGLVYELAGFQDDLRTVPFGLLSRHCRFLGLLAERPAEVADLRAPPLWTMLDRLKLPAAFVSWPIGGTPRPHGTKVEAEERDAEALGEAQRILGEEGFQMPSQERRMLMGSVLADHDSRDAAYRIIQASHPRVVAACLPGLGPVGATFMKYRRTEGAAGAPVESAEKYGRVLDRYYEMIDHVLGDVRASLPEGAHMIVVSAYGTEPLSLLQRLARKIARLDVPSAGHDWGPAGIFLFAGPGVAAGRQVDDLDVTDVVPITLYVLGAPVARDMDGRLSRRLFERWYLETSPITLIPTYN